MGLPLAPGTSSEATRGGGHLGSAVMGAVMGGRPERGPGVLLSSTRAKSRAKRCDVDQCVSSVQDRPTVLAF